jgi:acetylornithine deacetylase/succinyl-diaminopimelate desuccinylase-like protein
VRTNAVLTPAAAKTSQATLREVCEALAPMERLAGSEGEREAAEWIAARLEQTGARVQIDEEEFHDGFTDLLAGLAAGSIAAGAAGMTRAGRPLGVLGGIATGALFADDISNGFRPYRKAVAEVKTTWNVVAEIGDPDAERTMVVLAHHDAARAGVIFDQTGQAAATKMFPGIVERIDTSIPQWWGAVAAPALIAYGSAKGKRGLVATGMAMSALTIALLKDIGRSPVVPGANDNLSAVAVLVALAEALREEPVEGLRVILASCGAEEVLQGGIYGFARRHLKPLDRGRTWVLNFDTVGSPELTMLEGEGCVVMEDYFDRGLRDLCDAVAIRERIPMRRGMRSRNSTDAVIPSRMGIPTVCFASLNRHKGLSNYHSPTDVPENLHYATIACATDLAKAVARELAAPA